MGLLDVAKKKQEELTQELMESQQEQNNQEQIQAQSKMQSEIDKLTSLVQTLNNENESLKSRILSVSEIEKEKNKAEQEIQNLKIELNQQKRNQLTSQEQDKLNSVIIEIEKKKAPHNRTMGMEQFKEEIEKAKKGNGGLSVSDKINMVLAELEQEQKKPPAIEVREKEVVKLEPKCAKCNQREYTSKLGQLKFITYGALAYSIIITIIGIIKNDLIKSDFKTFFGSTWSFIQGAFKNANKGFSELSDRKSVV